MLVLYIFSFFFFIIVGLVTTVYLRWEYDRRKSEMQINEFSVFAFWKIRAILLYFSRAIGIFWIVEKGGIYRIQARTFKDWRVSFAPYKYNAKLRDALPCAGQVIKRLELTYYYNLYMVKLDSPLTYEGYDRNHILITPMKTFGEVESGKKYIMLVFLIPTELMALKTIDTRKGLVNMGYAMMYNVTGQEPVDIITGANNKAPELQGH